MVKVSVELPLFSYHATGYFQTGPIYQLQIAEEKRWHVLRILWGD